MTDPGPATADGEAPAWSRNPEFWSAWIWDPAADPPELTFWDRLAIWWAQQWHRYCLACDEQYWPWSRKHRSCYCGISRPDTWTLEDRTAFQAIIEAARRKHGGESRDLGPDR